MTGISEVPNWDDASEQAGSVWVPGDLFKEIAESDTREKRLCLAGWVLGRVDASIDGAADGIARARATWPANALEKPGRVSVLSALLEGHKLGLWGVPVKDGVGFRVEVGS